VKLAPLWLCRIVGLWLCLRCVSTELSAGEGLEWPQFRGPTGEGIAPDHGAPVHWSETENIAWKTRLPGQGWSSPVVDGDETWVTAATESGKSLRVICCDTRTGRIVRNIKVFDLDRPGGVHPKNGHASPTPVLARNRVYVHFGANGTACLERSGRILWKRTVPYYHHHGSAGSPVLVEGLLVVVCDGMKGPFYDKVARAGVDALQFVMALDAETGEIRWTTPRESRHSYATPLVISRQGRHELIAPGGDHVWAYDALSGVELWRCRYEGYSVIPRPVTADGVVYVATGYDAASLLAIELGGTGDITGSKIRWKLAQGVPFTPSAVVLGPHLYLLSDNGILSCVARDDGRVVWKQRLGGNYSASLTAIGQRIYCQSEDGQTHVVRAGERFEKLAVNRLKGRTFASLAVTGPRIVLRSDRFLYGLQEGASMPTDEPGLESPDDTPTSPAESPEETDQPADGSPQ
jgi:outer membrane protein assembly factor BamB